GWRSAGTGRRVLEHVVAGAKPTQWAVACSPGQVCAALGFRMSGDCEPTQWATGHWSAALLPPTAWACESKLPTSQCCADLPRATRFHPLAGSYFHSPAGEGWPRALFSPVESRFPINTPKSKIQIAMTAELSKLREILSLTLVEIEVAIDTATYPDWTETKENLLRAIDLLRKLERDQTWSKLSKKK